MALLQVQSWIVEEIPSRLATAVAFFPYYVDRSVKITTQVYRRANEISARIADLNAICFGGPLSFPAQVNMVFRPVMEYVMTAEGATGCW